ncbi:hypothetical protein E4U42_004535 [Claviceps africana]|uniref:Thiol methyltransferase n=1 Tax=Claviceps africana TaxID=83212 RepID=A0A8K0NG45_9HYPO|nr:hypothetical protein E4U42_004535 [Claviceps africana]
MSNSAPVPPGRLVAHFADRSRSEQTAAWNDLWESDDNDLWDRGMPSPALIDLIESRPEALCAPSLVGRGRLRALIPGCGRGYDVAMLALHGFDVCGLEVSSKGAQIARDYTRRELESPHDYNYGRKGRFETPPGSVQIITADFFNHDWETLLGEDGKRGFDLIYDYTFLCALLPEMRKDWSMRMAELVAPSGVLVCLEFPMYKDLGAVGPPWGLRGVHWNLLAEGKDGIIHEPGNVEQEDMIDGPFNRIVYISPERSYEAGRGTDMLSIWKPKKTA